MLRERLIVALLLVPIIILPIAAGGWVFNLFIALVLGVAAYEYSRIFRSGGYFPSPILTVTGVVFLALARAAGDFLLSAMVLAGLILVTMSWSVIAYEQGQQQAGMDFVITLGGIVYLGWVGPYLISLRALPDGKWWILLSLCSIWIADAGAYAIGRRFGKHPLSPRVSPKKSWEGYLSGITWALAAMVILAPLFSFVAASVSLLKALPLGLVIAILAPLGDLGESLIKRQFNLKDSGRLMPGHGGVFDRLDSWLWAGVIGYYMVTWLT